MEITQGRSHIKEHSVANEKVDEILKVHPGLSRSLSTKAQNVKQATVERNLVRLQKAKEALKKSRQVINSLLIKQQENFTRETKKLVEVKEEPHRFNYRELVKAEDAMRQILDIKKSFLKEITSKGGRR